MKKIALLLAIVLMGSSAFAVGMKGKMGYGVQGLALTTNSITLPTVQYYYDDETVGELGLAFASLSGGTSVSNFTLQLGMKKNLGAALGDIQPQWGVALAYTSNPNLLNNSSNLLIALSLGAKYFITPDFSIEGNIVPLAINSYNNPAGTNTTTISILNSASGVPAAAVGAHVYL